MTRKILLVDDEEGIRTVLKISLEDKGYEVHVAESGQKALEVLEQIEPPIVLTDIKMPGMDGVELLQKIKEKRPDTQVIMITGHGDMDLAIQSLKYDATDFVTKPIDDEVLDIALKRAIERITLREKLRQYTEHLERLVEEKSAQLIEAERLAAVGETAAAMAHAIKNCAGSLTGGMFVLEKGIELQREDYLRQGFRMVQGNIKRIRDMALDLLSYSKGIELRVAQCNPNEVLEEVYNSLLPRAQENGVELTIDCDRSLGAISMDKEQIYRCVFDLVLNAIDACTDVSCSKSARSVRLTSRSDDKWGVVYEIEDNGCGIPEQIMGKIFQRFFTTKGSKGTGLGLMLGKKIVDAHGGVIELESEKGKGTIAVVKLPHGPTGISKRCESDLARSTDTTDRGASNG